MRGKRGGEGVRLSNVTEYVIVMLRNLILNSLFIYQISNVQYHIKYSHSTMNKKGRRRRGKKEKKNKLGGRVREEREERRGA